MSALVTCLQKHLGVYYNLSFSDGEYDATDSRNLFVHGILGGHGGTCVTMPVLYIAVGRRLGYPLYLARAREHLFARWEQPEGERFNVECTCPGFFAGRPILPTVAKAHDRRTFSHGPISAESPTSRGIGRIFLFAPRCLLENLRPGEALLSACMAGQLAPKDPGVKGIWSIATVMARALEKARRNANAKDYQDLDLRKVRVPEGNNDVERWAAPIVRGDLWRIAGIRERAHAQSDLFSTKNQTDDGCFPGRPRFTNRRKIS